VRQVSNFSRTVLLFPRSGYVNRLQALASAILLARQIGADLKVCWQVQDVSPVDPTLIFDPAFVTDTFVTESLTESKFGVRASEIPLYLHTAEGGSVITLAGHDLGEQYFMPEFLELLARHPAVQLIVIIAGGKFTLEGASALSERDDLHFRAQRAALYGEFPLHNLILDQAEKMKSCQEPYLGLHLRYSDRSHQAPTRRTIRKSLESARQSEGMERIFIAGDSRIEVTRWIEVARELGYRPWSADVANLDRSDPLSAVGAILDWRLLGGAESVIFFAESSFGEEAAVATGNWSRCVGLRSSRFESLVVRFRRFTSALVTYPKRHGWLAKRHSQ
jgi:hypothetical protein